MATKSIISDERYCLVCGTPYNLHSHHLFSGTANRKLSEQYGLKVWLCAHHHNMSNEGVHFNKKLDNLTQIVIFFIKTIDIYSEL